MKPYRELPVSNDPFDMWRLGQAGGKISYSKTGQAFFRFDTKAQFQKYMELNSQRGA
ncbi:hypothetical protein [Alteribacillus sp. YIM 98480]|uniref:hypothetical protein n=1 Tax=Alteribacillus sp. YIM 98480 TaxID=2606599 RepID=UPI00131B018A|nr:hypothetical protein [Alteribacillus sp. YIM 98480]